MTLTGLGIVLLFCNAAAHVVSAVALRQRNAATSDIGGVAAFALINAAIGAAIWAGQSWAEWLAIAFPTIGAIGLLTTWRESKAPRWVNIAILALDIALITIFLVLRFQA